VHVILVTGCFVCCPRAGNAEDKNVPALVQALVGHKIVDVDCGSGDAHTLALEDNGTLSLVMHCLRNLILGA